MPDETCSRDEDLRDWLVGRLPAEAAKKLFVHLDRCPRCQAKLETVGDAGDTLIDCLRKPWVRDELLDEPQFQEAVARARAIGSAVSKPIRAVEVGEFRPDLVGQLGEYRILEKLAEGGMGTVYKARHTRLDREVAIKVLPNVGPGSERAIARFEQEMKAVGHLDHPHIVRALDAREVEGTRFLVLEYIEGFDLSKLIRLRGPLPVAEACRLVRQAAVGLQYAHEHDLIHRDVKPSNLIVDPQGQLKILDLGLARLRLTEPSGGEITQIGQTMGTAEYMAPEQAWDSHSVDVRADIYGLGCTLHYLLVGRPPYAGETDFQILSAHRESPIPSLRAVRDDVPKELDRVFRRMVAKSPAERQASMTEVIEDLQCCGVETEKLEDRSDHSNARSAGPRPTGKRRRVVAGLVVCAIAALVLLAGVILRLKTPVGTLILSVDQEDAEVVIDNGKITITPRGESEPTEIRLEEGEHRLTVSKGGFQTRTEAFTIKSGDREAIHVRLEPLTAAQVADRASGTEIASGATNSLPVNARERTPPPLAVAPFSPEQAEQHQQAWADYLGLPVEWKNSLGMQFVLIPPGEFLMGSSEEEQTRFRADAENLLFDISALERWIPAEGPHHRVQISQPFYLGKHEVTQAQWEAAMGNNPSIFKAPASPVENVSWHEVQFFLRLNGADRLGVPPADLPLGAWNMRFTLPTEAQWEHACRAGTTTAFWFGDSADSLDEYVWFHANSGDKTHAVGQLKPNAWGLYDIHGNVWEWCADRYALDYYAKSPRTDPLGPPAGAARVFRGGCWGYAPCYCRSAFRRGISPDFRYQSLGFRLAAVLTGKR